jgi:hypothetical protein
MRCGSWWYSSIVIAWGIVATCGAFIRSSTGLCLQRFCLGLAEAGACNAAAAKAAAAMVAAAAKVF